MKKIMRVFPGIFPGSATAGIALIGAGIIAVTPLTISDTRGPVVHSHATVTLTANPADDPGLDPSSLLGFDLGSLIGQLKPYLDSLTEQILSGADWLYGLRDEIDSAMSAAGITGFGSWLADEHELIQTALVNDSFDPASVDPGSLFNPVAVFNADLSWLAPLLGLADDKSAELNDLLSLASQLLGGTLNTAVVALGAINPLSSSDFDMQGLTDLMTVLEPFIEEYSVQVGDIFGQMTPILDDLGFGSMFDHLGALLP